MDTDSGWVRRARGLGHPGLFATVAVLALNDHVLKSAWPSWVTGKPSDVAGVVLVAWLASVVVGRSVAVCVMAVGFSALKVVPGVAESVAPVLGATAAVRFSIAPRRAGAAVTMWSLQGVGLVSSGPTRLLGGDSRRRGAQP